MNFKDFSKAELISILEIIEGARKCTGRDGLKDILMKAKDLVYADKAICGIGRVSGNSISEVISIVNGNYPEGWLSTYTSEKLYSVDPIVKYHARFSITRFWDEIFKITEGRQERLVVENAADFGLRHGISSGIYVPGCENISILAFASDRDRFIDRHKKIMDIISLHVNNAMIRSTPDAQKPSCGPFHPVDNKNYIS